MKPPFAIVVSFLTAASLPIDAFGGAASQNVRQTTQMDKHAAAEVSVWTAATAALARQLDTLQNKVEEWGTVTLSSFILAPPVSREMPVYIPVRDKDNNLVKDKDGGIIFDVLTVPKTDGNGNLVRDKDNNVVRVPVIRSASTFGFDLQQSAQDYFNLAGTAEGTAQNSLRIFQQFSGAATAQFLPDEAAQYANQRQQILRQQAVGNEVQNDQLDLYRANLARTQQNQRFLVEAAQVHLDEAQQDVQKAESRQITAQKAVDSAKAAQPFDKNRLDMATADLTTANASLATSRQARDTAQNNLNSAMTQPIAAPSPPGGLPNPPTTFPTPVAGPVAGATPSVPTDITSTLNDIGKTTLVSPPASANFPTRARVIDAASNKAVQEILNFVGNPAAAQQFRDKTIIFGVTEVALNPGWRTKRDYSVRLDMRTTYHWEDAHAETVRRLVRSNLFPLSVRHAIATSEAYKTMLQQDDRDFLKQQERYLRLSKELVAEAEDKKDEAQQQVKDAHRRLEQAIDNRNTAAMAVKAARDKRDQSNGEAAKVAEEELRVADAKLKQAEVWISDATTRKQSAMVKLRLAQSEFEEALRQSEVNGANNENLGLEDFARRSFPDSDEQGDEISVAAVSPLMDTQNLDEASSYARQDDFALFLAASLSKAGFRGQAQAYERYVKQRRQDITTRSSAAVANSYSFAGGIYGFQIGPRLRALANPEARKSRPAQTLDKQTFPVLIMLGINPDDLVPILIWDGSSLKIRERQIKTDYSYQWVRPQHYFWPPWANKRKDMPTVFLKEWATNTDVFTRVADEMTPQEMKDSRSYRGLIGQERKKYDVLNSAFYGAHHQQTIPGYFLVPDRSIAVAQPIPVTPSSAAAMATVTNLPPMVSSVTANLPATGTGISAENPIKLPGKVAPSVTKDGTAQPAAISGSFSILVKGRQFEGLEVTKVGCVSASVKLNSQNPPTLLAPDLLLVSLDVSAKNGDFTLIMPYKTDKEHESLAQFGTQTTSPTLSYFVQD